MQRRQAGQGLDTWYASPDALTPLITKVGPPEGIAEGRPGFVTTALWLATAGLTVLDAGCGAAPLREPITAAGNHYVGVDVDSDAADHIASVTSLPFEDEVFDLVLCRSVLQYVLQPLSALREMERVLRPGGRLLCSVAFLEPWLWGSLIHFTPAGIVLLAREATLKVDNVWPGWSAEEAFAMAADQMSLRGEPSIAGFSHGATFEFAASVMLLCSKTGAKP